MGGGGCGVGGGKVGNPGLQEICQKEYSLL